MAITYHSGKRLQGKSSTSGSIDTTSSSGNTILTFTENGKFIPTSSFNVEYLVLGGGAGGAYDRGGGGGSGAFRTATGFGVTAQTYNITVGAGGDGGATASGDRGGTGGDSIFSTITAEGGGGGGTNGDAATYYSGNGSGGGGNHEASTGGTGGTYGNNGGSGSGGSSYQAGGGGGSGAVGVAASSGGAGGAGIANSITGSTSGELSSGTYYLGGGGAGGRNADSGTQGGLGGGGNMGNSSHRDGFAGDANMGSGGGGAYGGLGSAGGDGGSGIVIIKFSTSGNTYDTSLIQKPTNVPSGSRFEETDTRKFYTKDLNGWQEKGTALGYRHASTYAQNQPAEANPFTTINKQHFVEWFSGKQIPSYWNTYINSSGTITMSDEVDGGLEIDTVGSNGDWIRLDFGRKNQYSKTGAIAISVFKLTNVNGAGFQAGFYNGGTVNTQQPYYSSTSHATIFADPAQNSNFCGSTGGGSNTLTTLGTAIDTNWHTGKVECGSDYKFYLDGVLGTTITSNPPNVNLEPAIFARTPSSLNHSPVHIRYYEAYNT